MTVATAWPRGTRLPSPQAPAGGFHTLPTDGPLACREYEDVMAQTEERIGRRIYHMHLELAAADACEICAGCPIQQACLQAGIAERWTGIAGGRVLRGGEVKR